MTSLPRVTVIVPMRNEEHRIERCLDSIVANDYPKDLLEILVADGLSTDRSAEIVTQYVHGFGFVRLLQNSKVIVSAGLNLGIRQARGEILVVMGAHCSYSRGYLRTCVRELQRTGADVVGGTLDTQPGAETPMARSIALATQHPFGVGGSSFRTRQAGRYVDTVPYGGYRREVFDRFGLFNEKLVRNQDYELNARIRAGGGKLFLSPDLQTEYYNVAKLTGLLSQAFNNGRWLAQMWMVSAASFRFRHAVPLIFVALLGTALVLSPFSRTAGQFFVISILTYFLAALAASAQICLKTSINSFWRLIVVFAAHHIAYGSGSIVGLVNCAVVSSKQTAERVLVRTIS